MQIGVEAMNHIRSSLVLIITFSLFIYANSLKNNFVYDDEVTIVNNSMIADMKNIPKLFEKNYFLLSGERSYRPVVTFTYFLDHAVYGQKSWGYHFTNILLHAVNGALLFAFLYLLRFFGEGKSSIGLLLPAVLLFVSHPVLTEAINAISYREDLLAFLFYFATLNLYLILRTGTLRGHAIRFLYPLSCLTYFFSLLSKEMAVTLPAVIWGLEWIFAERHNRSRFLVLFSKYNTGYIAVTSAYLYLRFFYFHNPVESDSPLGGLNDRLMTIPWLLQSYLKLLLLPISLSADYWVEPVKSFFSHRFIVPVIFLACCILFVVRKGDKITIFGFIFFIVSLLPVYNLTPIHNPLAERYLYLPCAGFIIAIGSLIHPLPDARKTCLLIFIISLFVVSVVNRNAVWRSNSSLWSDTVKKMPISSRAHTNLGVDYQKEGYLKEAIYHHQTAIRLNPDYPTAHNNLGIAFRQMGLSREAIREFETALRLVPNSARFHNNMGRAYFDMGRINEAIHHYRTAVRLNPYYAVARHNLGIAYQKAGRLDEAMSEYQVASKLIPGYRQPIEGLYENISGPNPVVEEDEKSFPYPQKKHR